MVEAAVKPKPKFLQMYWHASSKPGHINLSQHKCDAEDWESNHMELGMPVRNLKDPAERRILTNVFSSVLGTALYDQCGVTLILTEDE